MSDIVYFARYLNSQRPVTRLYVRPHPASVLTSHTSHVCINRLYKDASVFLIHLIGRIRWRADCLGQYASYRIPCSTLLHKTKLPSLQNPSLSYVARCSIKVGVIELFQKHFHAFLIIACRCHEAVLSTAPITMMWMLRLTSSRLRLEALHFHGTITTFSTCFQSVV